MAVITRLKATTGKTIFFLIFKIANYFNKRHIIFVYMAIIHLESPT